MKLALAESMNGQEGALVERVFRVSGDVDGLDDVTFLFELGVDRLGAVDVPCQIESTGSIQRAPKVEAEFVAEGWAGHVLESAQFK